VLVQSSWRDVLLAARPAWRATNADEEPIAANTTLPMRLVAGAIAALAWKERTSSARGWEGSLREFPCSRRRSWGIRNSAHIWSGQSDYNLY
jgi:hypothetical protein